MAHLKERRGKWYLCYTDHGVEKRKSIKTDSKRVANEKLKEFELQQAEGMHSLRHHPTADVLQAYIDHMKLHGQPGRVVKDVPLLRDAFGQICEGLKFNESSPRGRTAQKQRDKAMTQDSESFQVMEVDDFEELTTSVITDWMTTQVRARKLSPRSANRRRQVLSALCTFAMNQRGVHFHRDINPVRHVTKFKEGKPKIVFMSLKEIDEQLAALDHNQRYQTMVATLIFTGLRRTEMLWLQARDVDLENGVIHVRAKEVKGIKWQTKTGHDRDIPINSALKGYLDRYNRAPSHGDWFFPSQNGLRVGPEKFTNYLAKLNFLNRQEVAEYNKLSYFAKKAGQPPLREVKPDKLPWNAKIFRHTYASQLAAHGATLFQIAKLIGNSHGVCERYYADLVVTSIRDVTEFGKAPAPVKEQGPVSATG